MLILVVGTPNSGKSRLAEELAVRYAGEGRKIYIATMHPFGEEGARRVKRHQDMRQGKGFETLEWETDIQEKLAKFDSLSDTTVLVECMSNLVGNEMHLEKNSSLSDEELIQKIINGVTELNNKSRNLIVVTNSFPLTDNDYDNETIKYIDLTEKVNRRLKEMSDIIYIHTEGAWVELENNK